jgi:hypothetical protein
VVAQNALEDDLAHDDADGRWQKFLSVPVPTSISSGDDQGLDKNAHHDAGHGKRDGDGLHPDAGLNGAGTESHL